MIDLEKHYGKKDPSQLVEIIESPSSYKSEVIEYCKERLSKLNIPENTIKSYARKTIKKRFYEYFLHGNYMSNTPIILDSFFLNPNDVKQCFRESKNEYMKYINDATRDLPSA